MFSQSVSCESRMNEDVDDLSSAGLKGVGDRFVDAI
jgi:hypothetical protein